MSGKQVAFWGSNFDPNPDIDAIRRKITHFIQGGRKDYGPYDMFERGALAGLKAADKLHVRFAGKHPCPGWLSTAPDFTENLYPEMYRSYIDKGDCRSFAYDFGRFVLDGTAGAELPVVIGVDHCLTGGIVKSFSERSMDPVVVVFDRHFDAIPPALRNQMVGYMLEVNSAKGSVSSEYEYYGTSFTGNYDTGSFLYYLIKEGILSGDRLVVLGIQDAPDERLREIDDKRVSQYLETYQWLKDEGVIIKTLSELKKPDIKNNLNDVRLRLEGKNVYLSVDLDVFQGRLGQITRYRGEHGLSQSRFLNLLQWCGLGDARLIGMDIMEMDVNRLALNASCEKEAVSFLDNLVVQVCKILKS